MDEHNRGGESNARDSLPETRTLPETTIRCFVRASVAAEPVDETIETLRAHEQAGRFERLIVDVWPNRVRLPDPASHDRVVETYRIFRAWADSHGVDLEPAFIRQGHTSQFTGASWEELIMPVICLAVYREGALVGVYPHRNGDEVVTVRDVLSALESDTLPTPGGPAGGRSHAVRSDACPACGGGLLNGQGLYLCPDCRWLGIATPSRTYREVGRPRRGRRASH